MISARHFTSRGTEPLVEVVELGVVEDRLFHNPTPQPDSLYELLPYVAVPAVRREKAFQAFTDILGQARATNRTQTMEHAAPALAFMEGLATDLKRSEMADASAQFGIKALCRHLRGPLQTILDSDRLDRESIAALRKVDQIVRATSRAQLLSPGMRRELGDEKYRRLLDLYEGGAAQLATAGAPDRRVDDDRGGS